jgi:hypothetical protein
MTLVNVYLIENQDKIKIRYKFFRIKGLVPESDDFERNSQLLRDRVSRTTKSPCLVVSVENELYIAQPVGFKEPDSKIDLVRATVIIESNDTEREIDCGKLDDRDAGLALRFLQFFLNGQLHVVESIWEPSAGRPYFQKVPDSRFNSQEACMYRGFSMRLVQLPSRRIGVCVDITRKYVSKYYLPAKITPDEFRRKYKGKKCVYEFGNRWYEIRLDDISGLDISQETMPDGTPVFDFIHQKTVGVKPQSLLRLPADSTVLVYKSGLGESRRVPSALCRLTFSTDHPAISGYHPETIMPPFVRRREIQFVAQKYLTGWKFQGVNVELSQRMLEVETGTLEYPDLEFGGGKILSLKRGNLSGTVHTTLEELGQARRRLLSSTDAGFFVKQPLDRQYLILPKSAKESYGPAYIEDLKSRFRMMYAPNGDIQYDPTLVIYNDSVQQSIYTLGSEILRSFMDSVGGFFNQGYGLVVIPRFSARRSNKEEELANLLMREFRKNGVYVSVAHTEVPSKSYIPITRSDGQVMWQIVGDEKQGRKLRGYLENVILNKILLLNGCWPFVLAEPLCTDLVIGIDVKNHTVGFVFVRKQGKTFTFKTSHSDQKEQLSRGHAATKLYELLKEELDGENLKVKTITIHRDGTLFDEELRGINDALSKLSKEGLIEKDFDVNLVEIKKSSRIPVRMFDSITPQGSMQELTENPRVGTFLIFHETAFLCATGRPFRYNGTTKPLQIVKKGGKMSMKDILQDVFSLSSLTWTKPDYCSRVPITIRMTDIRLRELAGEYDEDKLRFLEEGEE